MVDLKSCPFCGGKASLAMGFSSDGFHEIITYTIVCTVCDIGIFLPHRPENERQWTAYKTAEEAAEAWNRRAE